VIEIKVTPNRPDALGIHGIARDLAARGLGKLKPLAITPVKGSFPTPIGIHIDPALKAKGCPHFAGRLIRGVRNGPSPDWMQARLKAIGLRPISALVDITNYFCFGLNRPLHVFDAAKVKGNLSVRPATPKGNAEHAGRQDLQLNPQADGHRRRPRPGVAGRDHGRRGVQLHAGHYRCLPGKRLVGPDHRRRHRPRAEDQLRRPLPL
jgi:phenylalanyl-tRNA synthetase beta subunit